MEFLRACHYLSIVVSQHEQKHIKNCKNVRCAEAISS